MPTAAPSSSRQGPRLAPGLSKGWGQALETAGTGCAEEPGLPRWEHRSRGRAGWGGGRGASLPVRVRLVQLSSQRLTPGRGGYPGRRGAHWDFARLLPSFNPPVGPTGAFPRHCLTARRAAPRRRARADYFGIGPPGALPLCLPVPPPAAVPRPMRAVVRVAAILRRSAPGSQPGPQLVDAQRTP